MMLRPTLFRDGQWADSNGGAILDLEWERAHGLSQTET